MKMMAQGFSLIEMMICMAIMLILAAISYPSYTHHLVMMRRQHAELALQQAALRMQKYYNENNSYEGITAEILHLSNLIADDSYQLAINEATENTFKLSATPLASQKQHDAMCGALSLNEIGEHSISGNGSITDCWPY